MQWEKMLWYFMSVTPKGSLITDVRFEMASSTV